MHENIATQFAHISEVLIHIKRLNHPNIGEYTFIVSIHATTCLNEQTCKKSFDIESSQRLKVISK